MWPLLYILAIIVALFIGLVLFAAFDLKIDVRASGGGLSSVLKIRWMGISRTLEPGKTKKKTEQKKTQYKEAEKKRKKKKAKKEKNTSVLEDVSEYLSTLRDLQRPLVKLFHDMLHAIGLHTFSFDLIFGFSNPADTGIACGFLHPSLSFVKSRCNNCSYWIEPVFHEETLDLHIVTTLRFRVFKIIPGILRFVLNRKVIKAGWSLIRK